MLTHYTMEAMVSDAEDCRVAGPIWIPDAVLISLAPEMSEAILTWYQQRYNDGNLSHQLLYEVAEKMLYQIASGK